MIFILSTYDFIEFPQKKDIKVKMKNGYFTYKKHSIYYENTVQNRFFTKKAPTDVRAFLSIKIKNYFAGMFLRVSFR